MGLFGIKLGNSAPPLAIGSAIGGLTENSILFAGAAGVLAQDNANFSRTAAQFKYKTATEHLTDGAVRFEFSGINVGYTNGVVIESSSATGYSPFQLVLSNAAYTTKGYISVSNQNGMDFNASNDARWRFYAGIGGGLQRVQINASNLAVADPVLNISTGYSTQLGLRVGLAAAQSVDAMQVYASDGTTKLFAVDSTGIITNAGGATFIHLRSGANDRIYVSAAGGSSYYASTTDHNFLVGAGLDAAKLDANATAGNTRLLIYDVDNGTLERVSVGAADSGGAGYKLLRIAN